MSDRPPEAEPAQEAAAFSESNDAGETLRERAQREAQVRPGLLRDELSGLSAEAGSRLLHELRVHQIELELQNDELRRSQEELGESQARYFDLYDLAPVGYVTIGEKGLVLEANLTIAGLLDVARSTLVKQPWTRFIFHEDQDVYLVHRKQLLQSGAPQGCELRLMKSDGEPFWARLDARRAQGKDGTRVCRTTVSDISERKRAQAALEASEARHRALFESSPAALMTLAPPSWRFKSGNAAAVTLSGARDEADFISRTPWDASPERQPNGSLSAQEGPRLMDIALRDGTHSFEWTYTRAPGVEFQATVSIARMARVGAPLFQATVRDETHAKNQQALAAQTERLAAMGLLAASVGHEINNPLTYVLSNVESLAQLLPNLLLEPTLLTAATEQARAALDGIQRITRISKVLSGFSRMEAEDLSKVDVHQAVEFAITLAANEIRFHSQLVTDFKPLPAVWASEGKLVQVFLNLLVNAAHAVAEKGGEGGCITVRTWVENASAWAEIKDNGAGIAPENLTRIFEPFFSTKRIGMGSGLGLSICRNILSEFGGEIQVQSEVGKGTRFVVRLPVRAEAPKSRPSAAGARAPELPIVRGRVLIIDDEEQLRTVMKRLLSSHEIVTASSGKEAQAILELDEDFDLILCDLMMPDVTGMAVHQWLSARNPELARRIVFISGGIFGPVTAEYLTDAGNLKIDKPFDNRAFAHVVAERVREAKSDRPLPVDDTVAKKGED